MQKVEICKNIDDSVNIIVHSKEIINELNGKLSTSDIELSSNLMHNCTDYHKHSLDLLSTKFCDKCSENKNEYNSITNNKSIPYGNISSDIMFVKHIPSKLDCASLMSHADSDGYLLTLVLSKMKIHRNTVYFTDFVKCHNKNMLCDNAIYCAVQYFLKELFYIQPKIVIFEGKESINNLRESSIFKKIPVEIKYGDVYHETVDYLNLDCNIGCIPDIEQMLTLTGNDLNNAKSILWSSLNKLISSINK